MFKTDDMYIIGIKLPLDMLLTIIKWMFLLTSMVTSNVKTRPEVVIALHARVSTCKQTHTAVWKNKAFIHVL